MAGKVDIRLLCVFMVADRVDCPGGWKANDALMWFMSEVKEKGYLEEPIFVDNDILGDLK